MQRTPAGADPGRQLGSVPLAAPPFERYRSWAVARRGPLASLAVATGLAALLRQPALVETAYAAWASPSLVRLVAAASGSVPFGLAEPVMALGLAWLMWPVLTAVRPMLAAPSPRSAGRALVRGGADAALRCGLIAGWFYLAWGLNYARAPLVERQGWSALAADARPADAALTELVALCNAWVDHANQAYLALHGIADAGRPTALAEAAPDGIAMAWAALDAVLDEGFRIAAGELREGPSFAAPRGPSKPVRASPAMSGMRLAGFFFPWTGEANVNRLMPPFQLPQTMAHEKAHQRGIASEDEANFVGFLAAIRSPSPIARYSGHLFAQRQLLSELCARDGAACQAQIARRLPGVQRDVDAARAFWARFDGPAAKAHERVNDAYLELNGVAGGVDSYAESARLIVTWVRAGALVDGHAVVRRP